VAAGEIQGSMREGGGFLISCLSDTTHILGHKATEKLLFQLPVTSKPICF